MINLSNTTPAAIGGGTNVTWQSDASGNVSGYVAKVKQTVSIVANAVTFDASQGSSFLVLITSAITSMTITNPTDGQEITILFQQDGTGHAVTFAANVHGATAVPTTPNTTSTYKFSYNVGDTNWYSLGSVVGIT
jgi:hypothetical protein